MGIGIASTAVKGFNKITSNSFLEKHKENALISILWHNNYFFDYTDKGWLECYKSILLFIKENNFEVVTPEKILIEFQ